MNQAVRERGVGAVVFVIMFVFIILIMNAALEYKNGRGERMQIFRDCYQDPGCTLSAWELRELRRHEEKNP